jgi:hypothetical protein
MPPIKAYRPLRQIEAIAHWGTSSEEDLKFPHRTDTPEAAFSYLQQQLAPIAAAKQQ